MSELKFCLANKVSTSFKAAGGHWKELPKYASSFDALFVQTTWESGLGSAKRSQHFQFEEKLQFLYNVPQNTEINIRDSGMVANI